MSPQVPGVGCLRIRLQGENASASTRQKWGPLPFTEEGFSFMELFCSPCSVNPVLPLSAERASEAPAVSWEAREGLEKVLIEVFLALVKENVREGMVLDVGEGINSLIQSKSWLVMVRKQRATGSTLSLCLCQ